MPLFSYFQINSGIFLDKFYNFQIFYSSLTSGNSVDNFKVLRNLNVFCLVIDWESKTKIVAVKR